MVIDTALTRLQRQIKMSNHRRIKLADSTDRLIYYTAAIYHASTLFNLDDLIWSCFKQNQNLDYECKVWFIITIAYWLSSSIRNVQNLGQHLRGYDVDYTITPLIYLTFISYAYFSEYHKGALLLTNLHYATAKNATPISSVDQKVETKETLKKRSLKSTKTNNAHFTLTI